MRAHDHHRMLHTPFHPRVAQACELNRWDEWKGYTTPTAYESVEREYFAVRNSCGVFDLTPMTKYRIRGSDAGDYLDRLLTRNLSKLRIGQVMYVCWCDDAGQLLDDGTLFRLDENEYRLCSQERHLDWLKWSAMGFDVEINDETEGTAALAVQGPTSFAVLKRLGLVGVEALKPYRFADFQFMGQTMMVSRTGFTGDLGYELWIAPEQALPLWDALFGAGQHYGIRAFGTEALEVARIEAGFIQAGVDFVPAQDAIRTDRTRSPYEVGLGWLVDLKKHAFNGRRALMAECDQGSRFNLVKLLIEGNKPANNSFVFDAKGRHIGTVTSACWSPTTKSNLALASLNAPWGKAGDEMVAEIYYLSELKWERVMAQCAITENSFFDPKRRHTTPPGEF
ncbi:MAG: aminomethyltransferase family protein [Pseudomonadota bacterium]|jgi:aminomethyltransferase|nr:aminomethyltransferase family protein [Pseudomonadota bacterium]